MSSIIRRLQRKDSERRTGQSASSSAVQPTEKEPLEIRCPDYVGGIAFLVDGEHVVNGDWPGGKIRRWRVDNGRQVGEPLDAGSDVHSIAVSRDGEWIISGTESGRVQVWNVGTRDRVREIQGHHNLVCAVDVSPDATRIVTGSEDKTACVWLLSTGERFFGPWKHDSSVVAAKFSPDDRLVATAAWERTVRVYDEHGRRLVDLPIKVKSAYNNSLAWSPDSKRLFALSHDGKIHCLDASSGKRLSKWNIHSTKDARCIAVASNGTFIAASAGLSLSFWDTATQAQIGAVVQLDHPVLSLAISDNHNLATSGDEVLSLRNLKDILPSSYLVDEKVSVQHSESNEDVHHESDDDSIRVREKSVGDDNARPEEIIEQLRRELARAQRASEEQIKLLYDKIAQLTETDKKLRRDLAQSKCLVDEQTAQNESLRSWRIKADDENTQLKQAIQELQCVIGVHEQKHQYEALFAQNGTVDAAELLLDIRNITGEHIKGNKFLSDWLSESTGRCSKTLEKNGDNASNAGKPGEAVTAYTAALSLGSSTPDAVLAKWARAVLTDTSPREALRSAVKFQVSRFAIFRAICTILEDFGRLSEAVETFQQMQDVLRDTGVSDEQTQWERDFRERCAEKLVNLGDIARNNRKHEEAVRYYSDAITLDPPNRNEVFFTRADELIELNSSSYKGYQEKRAVLNCMGRYREAFQAFQAKLSIIKQSCDPKIRELRRRYIDATPAIRKKMEEAVHHLPTVLIDTDTGLLCDKTRQIAAFEELPIYDELRSSMTVALDHSRIQKEVTDFYRYVMFSHKWQLGEPAFQQVENSSVYGFPSSPAFDKLRNFCKLVVALQFKWAWSDTCCVNQLNREVQQESIYAMFRWYRRSSLTIVHLLGVLSESQEAGCLWKSIWNTRGWTYQEYQEYVASEVVQFYTEDWKPYLGLEVFNHKESPAVLLEMERATNVATQQLIILQPGLDRAREKLYLASRRQTTREEDMAYSLFGIFGVALPIMYGERNLAIGRLLEHILTRSDEVTLLAWTGHSGSLYSYLPAGLTVYNEIVPPHVPAPIDTSEMDHMVSALRSSIPDPSLVVDLYKHLYDLPPLSLVAGRLRLSGLVFRLRDLAPASKSRTEPNVHVYRATTPLLGDVEIKTTADLSGTGGLRLIHPWIGPLVDRDFTRGEAQFDLPARALRLLARLRQPFGGLLLALSAREQYRRVATDSLIMVRVLEAASLSELMDAVRTVEIQ